jgi:hypothetical protein
MYTCNKLGPIHIWSKYANYKFNKISFLLNKLAPNLTGQTKRDNIIWLIIVCDHIKQTASTESKVTFYFHGCPVGCHSQKANEKNKFHFKLLSECIDKLSSINYCILWTCVGSSLKNLFSAKKKKMTGKL